MTGFALRNGTGEGYRWAWEIRSLNGKGLEIRLRLPSGLEHLELPTRERMSRKLSRGSVQATLTAEQQAGAARFRINEDALAEVTAAMERIRQHLPVQPPTLDGILALRGVVEAADVEHDEAKRARFDALVLADLDACLASLIAAREREGAAIMTVLETRLDEMAALVRAAEASPARTPEAIRARLAEQAAALLGAAPALDPDRLHQEAVLLATRADIREEIDRLEAHVAAARNMLGEDVAVGRRLGFLSQEFSREVNTLCAKANDRSLIAIGLELKAVVDQFREQSANLE
jgi:uncharacterized protein (TIGR00255 family)